ncbi:MAG: hypothetical protein JSS51_04450 [Planctomycetes bacterium]|nr:hypothetical protein [Planctomycetota bacterium]
MAKKTPETTKPATTTDKAPAPESPVSETAAATAPNPAQASGSEPKADKPHAEKPPAAKAPQLKSFSVSLLHNRTHIVKAKDEQDAIAAYNAYMGITKTTHTHIVGEVKETEAATA